MAITKDKIASLVVFGVVATAVVTLLNTARMPEIGLFIALMVALFGLALVWCAEPLGEIGCFSRGVTLPSPPAMIEAFGWLFLVGYPVLLAFVMRWAPTLTH